MGENGVYLLGEDLTRLIEEYEKNPLRTKAQKARWRRRGRARAITPAMIGHDHPNALVLAKEDGFDGLSVGSMDQQSVCLFWDYGPSHLFPPSEDLIRLAAFMHLDIYRALALVLKGEWEFFHAHDYKGWRPGRGSVAEILGCAQDAEVQEVKVRFNPDTRKLYQELERCGRMVSSAFYDEESFDLLAQEMILADIHRVALRSAEMDDFAKRMGDQWRLFQEGTPEEQQEFWFHKCVWIDLQEQLGDECMRMENHRLKNANIRRQWLKTFGPMEIELQEAIDRYTSLERRIHLKQADPDLNREEVSEMVAEIEKRQKEALRELILQEAWAKVDPDESVFGPIDKHGIQKHQEKSKKVLREIWKLVHEDRLIQSPEYQKLSLKQKEKLREILLRTLSIRPEETGYSQAIIRHDMRSIQMLERILEQVKRILGNAGIDTPEDSIVRGNTLAEQIDWLKGEIQVLDRQLMDTQAALKALLEDSEARHQERILKTSGQHLMLQEEMKAQTREYSDQADALEAELEALFAKDSMQSGIRS